HDKTNGKAVSVLNHLIETCKDGQEGFKHAAQGVKSSHLKSLFMEFAEQRAQFASQLRAEVARLGGKPEAGSSVTGSLHRGWTNLKAAISGGSEAAIISECERGEDIARDTYRDAL